MKLKKRLPILLIPLLFASSCSSAQQKIFEVSWPKTNSSFPIFFKEIITSDYRARLYTSNEKFVRKFNVGPIISVNSNSKPHWEGVVYTKGSISSVEWSNSAGVKVGAGGNSASVTFETTYCTSLDSSTSYKIETYIDSNQPHGFYQVVRNEVGRKFLEFAFVIENNKVKQAEKNGIEFIKPEYVFYSVEYSQNGIDWKPFADAELRF